MRRSRPIGTRGIRLTDTHRAKILASNILSRLIAHAEGKLRMTPSEVKAGLGLLKKALPDLSNVTIAGDEDTPLDVTVEQDAERFTRAIAALAARTRTGEGDSRTEARDPGATGPSLAVLGSRRSARS
jgi:hypothetical protein